MHLLWMSILTTTLFFAPFFPDGQHFKSGLALNDLILAKSEHASPIAAEQSLEIPSNMGLL